LGLGADREHGYRNDSCCLASWHRVAVMLLAAGDRGPWWSLVVRWSAVHGPERDRAAGQIHPGRRLARQAAAVTQRAGGLTLPVATTTDRAANGAQQPTQQWDKARRW
jgi:hypothetical protein